jgi:hypothetical protein
MRSHQCGSLCRNGRVVRKDPFPPDIEAFDMEIQTRLNQPVVRPVSGSCELATVRVELLARIH